MLVHEGQFLGISRHTRLEPRPTRLESQFLKIPRLIPIPSLHSMRSELASCLDNLTYFDQ